jgi:hypothetical protein
VDRKAHSPLAEEPIRANRELLDEPGPSRAVSLPRGYSEHYGLGGPVQLKATSDTLPPGYRDHYALGSSEAVARAGLSGPSQPMPHAAELQQAFDPSHDVSSVRAHVGGAAADAARSLGADGFAMDGQVAFRQTPSLHLAAHEAAHVLSQQRGAVNFSRGVGAPSEVSERHADAVADLVVSGQSASALLDAPPTARPPSVQLGHERSAIGEYIDIAKGSSDSGNEWRMTTDTPLDQQPNPSLVVACSYQALGIDRLFTGDDHEKFTQETVARRLGAFEQPQNNAPFGHTPITTGGVGATQLQQQLTGATQPLYVRLDLISPSDRNGLGGHSWSIEYPGPGTHGLRGFIHQSYIDHHTLGEWSKNEGGERDLAPYLTDLQRLSTFEFTKDNEDQWPEYLMLYHRLFVLDRGTTPEPVTQVKMRTYLLEKKPKLRWEVVFTAKSFSPEVVRQRTHQRLEDRGIISKKFPKDQLMGLLNECHSGQDKGFPKFVEEIAVAAIGQSEGDWDKCDNYYREKWKLARDLALEQRKSQPTTTTAPKPRGGLFGRINLNQKTPQGKPPSSEH